MAFRRVARGFCCVGVLVAQNGLVAVHHSLMETVFQQPGQVRLTAAQMHRPSLS